MDVAEEIDLIGLRIYDSDKRWRAKCGCIFSLKVYAVFSSFLPRSMPYTERTRCRLRLSWKLKYAIYKQVLETETLKMSCRSLEA
jgi:hypothetical protein